MSTVGQNLTLNMEAVGKASLATVHSPNYTPNPDEQRYTYVISVVFISKNTNINYSGQVVLHDVQSGEEKDFVIELSLPAVEVDEEEGLVLKTSLSYFDITSTQVESMDGELRVARRGKVKVC